MISDVIKSLEASHAWVYHDPGPPFDFLAGQRQVATHLGRVLRPRWFTTGMDRQ